MKRLLLALFIIPTMGLAQNDFALPQHVSGSYSGGYGLTQTDLNGDGSLDFVLAEGGRITWLEGLSNGTFTSAKVIFSGASSAARPQVADIDNDGDSDIVFFDTDERVYVAKNQGSATEFLITILSDDFLNIVDIQLADLNNDGDLDIVVSDSTGDGLHSLENDGNGHFLKHPLFAHTALNYAQRITVGDFDEDGNADVMVTTSFVDDIVLVTGNGNHGFETPITIDFEANSVVRITQGDFNSDGHLDIIVVAYAQALRAYFGDGQGGFSDAVLFGNSDDARDLTPVDIDADGDLDLVVAMSDDDDVTLFINDGSGTFDPGIDLKTNLNEVISISIVDLTNDGVMELCTMNDGRFTVYEGIDVLAEGFFGSAIYSSNPQLLASDVHVADIDNDGMLDVIAGSEEDDDVVWYRQIEGGFEPARDISLTSDGVRAISAGDFNEDGYIDIATAQWDDNQIAYYRQQDDGSGFHSETSVTSSATDAIDVLTADLNGDGHLDLLSAAYASNEIAWYSGDGSGGFSDEIVISANANGAWSVAVGDLDGDGDLEVLSASSTDHKIAWYDNLGGGAFASPNTITTTALNAKDVVAADFDNDGLLDVAYTGATEDEVAWSKNMGGGVFQNQGDIGTLSDGPRQLRAGDLESDGDMDLVSTSFNDGFVYVYINDGAGNFTTTTSTLGSFTGLNVLELADMNNDGNLDLIWVSSGGNAVFWQANLMGIGCTSESACNYNPTAIEDNGSCCFGVCGCTNAFATNFNPEATCPLDEQCIFPEGCTDPSAFNFDVFAYNDDGSCEYAVTGHVFDDLDEDGNWDSNEYALAYRNVQIPSAGVSLITNDEGQFHAVLPPGTYEVYVAYDPNLPYNTTPNPVTLELGEAPGTGIEFGISKEMPLFGICVDLYPSAGGLCDSPRNFNICYRNMGNVPVSGTIALEYDPLFQGFVEVNFVDSVDGNIVYMSFENLNPGQMYMYDIELITPTVEHIGEMLHSTVEILGFFEGNPVASGTQENTTEVTCAYDPNDKQVFPNGHTDDHLILQETHLEYLIRFQNTGNAPAFDVLLRDTLDANLDMSTFTLMANSHSVMVSLDEDTREVVFFFEDILLPDSIADEPGSHGLASYKIRPYPDLPTGTEINNTAYIYFDNNPPVVTNTTWSTIHDCAEVLTLAVSTQEDCPGMSTLVESNYESGLGWTEHYDWTMEGVEIGNEELLVLPPNFTQSGLVELTVENPLCIETAASDVVVDPEYTWATCNGDLNCDHESNSLDILAFLGEFACSGPQCHYDFDGDGYADSTDLLSVLGAIGTVCE